MVPTSERVLSLERRHTSGLYPKRELAIVRGEGARLFDAEGKAYVDCVAGHGVAALGHGRPEITGALAEQARRLITCPETLPNEVRADYAARLSAALPGAPRRIFFCNSGTEAVEAAIKVARLVAGRAGIVACKRGFHGRTLGALSATWERRHRTPFEPLVPEFTHVPFDVLEAADEAIDASTACFLVEVVQGEGGVHPATGAYLRGVQELCRERGALFAVDEVQTGFGRTGRLFASEHHGLEPDLIALGKAIAGGLPMGALGIGERVGELPLGAHGSTFGGNPLACATATAVLDVLMRERLAERAATVGAWLVDRLRALESPLVREVRGLGLLVGVELRRRATPVLRRLLERGVLALPAGPTVVRLLPPLTISREDLETVVDALAGALAETESED